MPGSINGYDATYYINTANPSNNFIEGWTIFAAIFAIIVGLALLFTFLRHKNADKYTGTAKHFYDFLNFRTLWLEPLLKGTYLIAAIFITIWSFGFLSEGADGLGLFLCTLLAGNLIVRLAYEFANLTIILVRNTNDINEKLNGESKTKTKK